MFYFVFFVGNSACVQLMIDRGAFMEAHDCHYGTPLHVACARQHYECAKVLLIAGDSRLAFGYVALLKCAFVACL